MLQKKKLTARIEKLKVLMEKASLDGAFFHYKIDYYYLSGTMQDSLLFVPAGRRPDPFCQARDNPGAQGITADKPDIVPFDQGYPAAPKTYEAHRHAARRHSLQ